MKKKIKIKEWIKKSGVTEVKGIENFEEGNINNVKCSWKPSKKSPFGSEAHLLDLALRTGTGQGWEKEILA